MAIYFLDWAHYNAIYALGLKIAKKKTEELIIKSLVYCFC